LVYYLATRADTVSFAESESIPSVVKLVPFALAVAISGVNGLIALAYEIIWYRVYSFSTANKSATFAFMLGMYLLGIAIGALVAERICGNPQRNSGQQKTVGVFIVVGNLMAFAIAPLASYSNAVTKSPVLGFLLLPIGALLLGTVFPLICSISISPNAQAGKRMSQLYFSNIVGSVLGSFVVGYLLMDFFSTAQVSLLLVAIGVLAGLTLLAWGGRSQWRFIAMLSLASVVVVAGFLPTFTHLYLRLLPYYPVTRELEYLVENKSGVVAVLTDRTVIGAGAYEGTFNTDPLHDENGIFRAYALSVLHPAPKKVLQIGLATGSWAQVIVNNPSVEQLTIVEINPGYLSLIPKYPEVQSLLSNPKATIEIDDARRWLRRHPEKFDAVVMNTIIHSHANATNLLSREYLELVKAHLNPGAVFYYNTTDSANAQITAATVFPYLVRVWNFVAVSESPIVLDKERWLNTMRAYTIDGQPVLAPATAARNEALLQLYARWIDQAHGDSPKQRFEYADTLRKRYKGRTTITDDNMASEWED
jgi:spermidine synthase